MTLHIVYQQLLVTLFWLSNIPKKVSEVLTNAYIFFGDT